MEYVIYTIAFTIWINALLWIDVILGKSWLYTLALLFGLIIVLSIRMYYYFI